MSDSQTETAKEKVMGKFNEVKKNIETFVDGINVNEIKSKMNVLVKDAQKDFNKLVDKDLEIMKKKLQKEKTDIEAKAKKFLDGHKKELNLLQSKFDKLVKASSKLKSSKSAAPKAAATTKKKASKKVAKAAKKVAKK